MLSKNPFKAGMLYHLFSISFCIYSNTCSYLRKCRFHLVILRRRALYPLTSLLEMGTSEDSSYPTHSSRKSRVFIQAHGRNTHAGFPLRVIWHSLQQDQLDFVKLAMNVTRTSGATYSISHVSTCPAVRSDCRRSLYWQPSTMALKCAHRASMQHHS